MTNAMGYGVHSLSAVRVGHAEPALYEAWHAMQVAVADARQTTGRRLAAGFAVKMLPSIMRELRHDWVDVVKVRPIQGFDLNQNLGRCPASCASCATTGWMWSR